jgi:hypothetical protein
VREPRARRSPLKGGGDPRARWNPLEGGVSPRARRNPLEGGGDSRARRNLLEGGVSPRARRNPLEGGVSPRARRNPLEGALDWATLVGRGGHRSVGRAVCACLGWRCVSFCFLQVLSRISPVFRGPSGLSPTLMPQAHVACRGPRSSRSRGELVQDGDLSCEAETCRRGSL